MNRLCLSRGRLTLIPNEVKEAASKLSNGDSTYIPHEGCTTNAKMWVYKNKNGYGFYCNKCGEKGFKHRGIVPLRELVKDKEEGKTEFQKDIALPEDISLDIDDFPLDARLWLYKADIRDYQIEKYGIGYSKYLHRVILPVYDETGELLMWQGRGLTPHQTKYYNVRGSGKSGYFFKSWVSYNKIHSHTWDRVVVVEDVLSVIKVGRSCPTVAGLGTSLSQAQINYLGNFNRVTFWYDDDKGGLKGSEKGMKALSLITKVDRIRTQLDPKNLSYDEINQIIKEE